MSINKTVINSALSFIVFQKINWPQRVNRFISLLFFQINLIFCTLKYLSDRGFCFSPKNRNLDHTINFKIIDAKLTPAFFINQLIYKLILL